MLIKATKEPLKLYQFLKIRSFGHLNLKCVSVRCVFSLSEYSLSELSLAVVLVCGYTAKAFLVLQSVMVGI